MQFRIVLFTIPDNASECNGTKEPPRSSAKRSADASSTCRGGCDSRGRGVRAYSPSKVIHRWRGEPGFALPQPPVNNFGGNLQIACEQLSILLNGKVEHAGAGGRIPRSNGATFQWRLSPPASCALPPRNTQNPSPASANWQRRTSISSSIRQGPRAQHD